MKTATWDDEGKRQFCSHCLWKDEDPNFCHCMEPPDKNHPFTPSNSSDCYFISKARFDIWPKEYQERAYKQREERSKRYWAWKKKESAKTKE